MIADFFKFVFESIKNRKMRSWLTMIGIFIGIAAIVSLVSLGEGLQKSITDEFSAMGTDKIFVQLKSEMAMPGSTTTLMELTEDDAEVVNAVKGVDSISTWIMKNVKIEFNNQVRFFYAFSIPTTDEGKKLFDEMMNYDIEGGRGLRNEDKFKVVLGIAYIKDNVFTPNVKVGDKIKLNDMDFKVVGYYERIGNTGDDQNIIVSEDTMRDIFEVEDRVDYIIAKVAKGEKSSVVAERIEKDLRDYRNIDEGKEDFTVQTYEQLIESFQTILNIVQAVLIGIAAISLIVGGVGIMNTMYTAVLERTQEIGIMKAIGARNSDVLKLFLIEAGSLGMVGGAIGVTIGYGLGKLVEFIAAVSGNTIFQAYFPWYLMIGALAFSFGVGALSGLLPAIQASRKNPVDALRYE